MADFFSISNLFTLGMLVLLQAVLGFDNLLYISIESKRAPEAKQAYVRKLGLMIAIGLRIVLLFAIMSAIEYTKTPFFHVDISSPWSAETAEEAAAEGGVAAKAEAKAEKLKGQEAVEKLGIQEASPEEIQELGRLALELKADRPGGRGKLLYGDFTLHSLITLFGGVFILYTAIKEIMHLLAVHDPHEEGGERKQKSVAQVISLIVIMNLVFSFDSILAAIAITQNFWTMATAIVISGAMMILLADHVAEFLKKNRLYEVLGLFILFIVGVMLLGEGGHLAHLTLFNYHVEPMAKSTFYFTIAVLVVIDVVQGRYQKNLLAQQAREAGAAA